MQLTAAPGTVLDAGGDEVHAGPKTDGPRMFAFAVGVCAEEDGGDGDDARDGEVQYNAVTLHVDLCCVASGFLEEDTAATRRFLLDRLVGLVEARPDAESYALQLGDREDVASWLARLVDTLASPVAVAALVAEAVASETLFYAPGARRDRSRKGRRRRRAKGKC